MKNITVAVSDIAYLKARVWAAEHDTSISAVVAWFLNALPAYKAAARQFSTQPEPRQPGSPAVPKPRVP
jgi:hypothetical protein